MTDDTRERRSESRMLACIPAYVALNNESPRIALIRDASTTGALLLTRSEFTPGEAIGLRLYLTSQSAEARPAQGRVARCQRRGGDHAELWPWEIGVSFDPPISEYADEIKQLNERQASYGLFKH